MSSISDIPRQELCILISTYGRSLCEDPQRCEALLRDYCGSYRREITLLVSAMKEQIPSELSASVGKVPYEVLRSRLAKKLEENLAITTEAAHWTVDAWAAALEISTPSASSPLGDHGSGSTRMEPFPSQPAGPSTPPPATPPSTPAGQPTQISSNPGLSSNPGESAPTQIRPGGAAIPPYDPPSSPSYDIPGGGSVPQSLAGSSTTSSTTGGAKPNSWLIGGIVGASVVGLGALVMLLAMFMGMGSEKMRAALQEAKQLREEKEYSKCVKKLQEFTGFDEAKEEAHGCHLDLAKELAAKGKLVEAMDEAKLITEAPSATLYQEAQDLLTEWSKGKQLKIFNECTHPVEVALRFIDPKTSTNKPDGWWKLEAGDGSFLSDQGERIRVLNPVLFYAQATDGSGLKWEGDIKVVLQNKTYNMQTLDPSVDPADGSFRQTLTCKGN